MQISVSSRFRAGVWSTLVAAFSLVGLVALVTVAPRTVGRADVLPAELSAPKSPQRASIVASQLVTAIAERPYHQLLEAATTGQPVNWTAQGELPPGLELTQVDDGGFAVIAGVPQAVGAYSIILTLSDQAGVSDTRQFFLEVVSPGPAPSVGGAWIPTADKPAKTSNSTPSSIVRPARGADLPLGKPAIGIATRPSLSAPRALAKPGVGIGGADAGNSSSMILAASAPIITTQPVSQTVNLTESAVFSVATTGTPPAFQWQKNGTDITGAHAHFLLLPRAAATDAASYRCVVTNEAGAETSDAATLTVNHIVPLLLGTTAVAADTFSDGNRSGDDPAAGSLQWYCSGPTEHLTVTGGKMVMTTTTQGRHAVAHFPITAVPVGAAFTLSFDFALGQPVANGVFRFGVFRHQGSNSFSDGTDPVVESTGYAVYTNIAPTSANPSQMRERDNRPAATLITGSTAFGSALDGGGGGPAMSFANGVTYQAKFTVLRTGAEAATLSITYSGGDLAGYTVSRRDVSITDAFDTVALCLYGSGGVVAAQSLTVDNVALTLSAPQVLDAFTDGNRSGDAPPESLAWWGSSAGSSNLTVSSGAMTLATTGAARHAVAHFPAATLLDGETLTLRFAFKVSNPHANRNLRLGLFHSNGGVRFTADANPQVAYTGYAVFLDPTGGAAATLQQRNAVTYQLVTNTTGGLFTSLATGGSPPTLVSGVTYQGKVSVTRVSATESAIVATISGEAIGSYTVSTTDSTPVTGIFDTVALCIYGASGTAAADALTVDEVSLARTGVPSAPVIVVQPASRTVPFGDTLALGVTATGLTEPTYQWRKNATNIPGATLPYYSFTPARTDAAGTYSVVVSNPTASFTSDAAVLTVNDLSPLQTVPSITTHPVSQSVAGGGSVTFTVSAAGTPAPTYQWFRNGVTLSNATGSSYTVTSATADLAGSFTVTARNSSGSVTSNAAILTVTGAPHISQPPLTQAARTGSTVILRVAAAGEPPLRYQWAKDNVPLPGATDTTLVLPNVQAGDAGSYTVAVSNGSVSNPLTTTSAPATLTVTSPTTTWHSAKVVPDGSGGFTYPVDAEQNRVVDFSHAGYEGGGVPLPTVPVKATLAPSGGDDTTAINNAIATVGGMPLLDGTDYRGTVLLTAGVYRIDGTIRLNQSGVVLAGVGAGEDPAAHTILRRNLPATDPRVTDTVVIVGGGSDDKYRPEVAGSRSEITSALVPVGARSFTVDNPGLYAVNDNIIVYQPSTDGWLAAIDYGGTAYEPWQPDEKDLRFARFITAISGNTLTVDAPIFNHLDRSLAQSYVYKYDRMGLVTHVGIDNFLVDIVAPSEVDDTKHAQDAIEFIEVEDGWAHRVTAQHFNRWGIALAGTCTRTTVDSCRAIEPHSPISGGRRYNFASYHSQLVLFRHCYSSNGRHSFINSGGSLDSGVVFLDCVADNTRSAIEPHAWWSTATLFDNVVVQHPFYATGMQLYNAGDITDHGWCAAHTVAWRCDVGGPAYDLVVQKPPTAQNYAIGCFGYVTGDGAFEEPAGFIEGANQDGLEPRSLYRAQLAQRLGVPASGVQTSTLLSDSFADGDRTAGVAWLSSGTSAALSVPIGTQGMKLDLTSTTTLHGLTNFPRTTLAIGDTLTLSFNFVLTNPVADSVIRFGLFDSAGAVMTDFTADGANPSVAYPGYAVFTNVAPSVSTKPTSLRQRLAAGQLLTTSGAYGTGSVLADGGGSVTLLANTTYTATLKLVITGSNSGVLTISYTGGTLANYTVTAVIPSRVVASFDTLAICAYGSSGSPRVEALSVDNVALVRLSRP